MTPDYDTAVWASGRFTVYAVEGYFHLYDRDTFVSSHRSKHRATAAATRRIIAANTTSAGGA